MSDPTEHRRPAGRPRRDDGLDGEVVLAAALRAFAIYGYDGVSIRTLNRELGVSHNLINHRYGSKAELWRAAVDHGFGGLVRQLESVFDPTLTDPLDQLSLLIESFVLFSARHPELLGLMDIEGRQDTERLDYVYDEYIRPALAPAGRLIDYLVREGKIRPISLRSVHFLMAHGAAAPFTLVPLAQRFDPATPLDEASAREHAALMAKIIVTGLRPEA